MNVVQHKQQQLTSVNFYNIYLFFTSHLINMHCTARANTNGTTFFTPVDKTAVVSPPPPPPFHYYGDKFATNLIMSCRLVVSAIIQSVSIYIFDFNCNSNIATTAGLAVKPSRYPRIGGRRAPVARALHGCCIQIAAATDHAHLSPNQANTCALHNYIGADYVTDSETRN